jgi:hypothetical protein
MQTYIHPEFQRQPRRQNHSSTTTSANPINGSNLGQPHQWLQPRPNTSRAPTSAKRLNGSNFVQTDQWLRPRPNPSKAQTSVKPISVSNSATINRATSAQSNDDPIKQTTPQKKKNNQQPQSINNPHRCQRRPLRRKIRRQRWSPPSINFPRTCDGRVVADDARADHRQRLALRRVDLARHNRRPGLVLGQRDLAETAARAGAKEPVCIY